MSWYLCGILLSYASPHSSPMESSSQLRLRDILLDWHLRRVTQKSYIHKKDWGTNTDCCSVTESYLTVVTPWTAAHQDLPSFIVSWSSFKLMSIESVMSSHQLILCRPLLLLSIFSCIRDFFPMSHLFKELEIHRTIKCDAESNTGCWEWK